ncbi:MAG: hypothetical protein OEM97_05095 [Acidimicrobiia bacterium]|nr:hypothetical protein [Acidimicrobiia bacterium]
MRAAAPHAPPTAARLTLVGVALASSAVLVLEVVLTRVFAVTQFYHFAFLTVSLALLGFGASGSALAAFPALGRGGPRRWATLAASQAISTVGAYVVVNSIPFDSFSLAWDRRQLLYLLVYYLALAVPFFFGGALIGTLLAGWDQPAQLASRTVYAASLVGSGVGALIAVAAVAPLGGEGVVLLAAALAMAAAFAFRACQAENRPRPLAWFGGALLILLVLAVSSPSAFDMQLSPYKGLAAALRFADSELIATEWRAAARVDLVRSEAIRSLPGLSFTYTGAPAAQDGLTFDADDLSPVPRVEPDEADFVPYLMTSLPFTLRPGGDALVLGPRGGLDVLVGLASGAATVTAVEPNAAAVDLAASSPASPYADPRVGVVVEDPRAFIDATTDRFDVIDLALTQPYRPVASGAYSLGEDYSLTVEAFGSYLSRLRPGGILAVMRWVQTPPSEETRLLATVAAAVQRLGLPADSTVVALRGYATALVLVRPDGFGPNDLASIRRFVELRRFDFIAMPGLAAGEMNRFNVLPVDDYSPVAAELLGERPEAAYAAADFNIEPPTDDRPFFGHFFKWSQAPQVLDTLGRTWQPFGGAGYFVLLALLVLSTLGAVALIVAPLLFRRLPARHGRAPHTRWWTIGYFGLLGIGFLFVEIPLVQRFILLVGRPTTALAVVLFALLLASGVGSLASARVPWPVAAVALVAAIVAYPTLIGTLTRVLLQTPLAVRVAAGALALAPLGFLMGTMFPKGLAHLEARGPDLVPWAWGINGTASVISAASAAILALSHGFTLVIWLGAVCYAGAGLLAVVAARSPVVAQPAKVSPG